jgi:hypothetical protein
MFNSRFGVGVLKHPGYNIGGGIGESLLASIATSAVIGGGVSALTGGDFLEGALMGGLSGGIGHGIKGLDFGKLFNPSNAAPAIGADAGAKGITAAGAQAYVPPPVGSSIPTSPFNTFETVAATSPAGIGFGAGTAGTSGITNLAANAFPGVAPDIAQKAMLQNLANEGIMSNATDGVQPGGQVAGQTPLTYEEQIKKYNIKPKVGADTNAIPGSVDKGMYVGKDGMLYDTKDIIAAQNPSFFDKYKTELLMGGLGLGYKMLTAPPKTAYSPPAPSGPIMKYKLGPNYQAVPNPTPVYPRFAEGGIAQLADGGNMEVSHPNVNFMGRDMYPMSQQDRSFYATPSQMPVSAQQTMANYEPKTNPLTGQPTVNMSSGGPISFASGGSSKATSGQVYYDADKGQYYTVKSEPTGPWGYLGATVPGFASMSNYGQNTSNRNYIGSALRNPGSGISEDFKASSATPIVYNPSYVDVPGTTTEMPTQEATPAYSLNDSAQLLASVSPKIAEDSNIRPMARGGIADLGTYSDGGRMLKGPGDGMSDSIPGVIANKRPARLADGEFVVPADVVSHLGNGSTDAGAKQLYAMMNRVRQARTGNKKQGKQINPRKLMTA